MAVWAGRLLEARDKVSDAMALYTQATETVPTFADGWSARLLAASRLGEAETTTVTNLAVKALPKKAFFSVCAETGAAVRAKVPTWSPPVQTAEDQKAYAQACIAACEARGRLEDAVPVLKAMSESPDMPKPDADWAKQTIAALTAALGTPEQKQGALNTLRTADTPATASEVRTRLNALGIALRSAGGDDRRAVVRDMIRLLAGLVRDPSATSNDWFQLAQLYRVAGDRASCRKCLEELTKREPNNLVFAAARLDDLLSENDLGRGQAARGQDRGRDPGLPRPEFGGPVHHLDQPGRAGPRSGREVRPGRGPRHRGLRRPATAGGRVARPTHATVIRPRNERLQAPPRRGGRTLPSRLPGLPGRGRPAGRTVGASTGASGRPSTNWTDTRPASRRPPSPRAGSRSCAADRRRPSSSRR